MKGRLQFFLIGCLLCLSTFAFAQEPSNHATSFAVATVSDTEIELTWTDATGATLPEFYLIVGRAVVGGTFASVADGPEVPADADWSDDNFAVIVAHTDPDLLSITGLTPGLEYQFRIYSYTEGGGNGNYKIAGAPTQSGFTLSSTPSAHSTTFAATLNGDVDIDLVFDAANTLTNADGYLIYRRAGSAASLTGLINGAAPPATLGGTTNLVFTTDDDDVAYADMGLLGGVTYHYVLVPFNYNGTDDETYTFLSDGLEPRDSETTNLIISILPLAGGITASPLGSGATDEAILGFSITTNGPTTFNALNVDVTSTAVGKFTTPRIFSSADATYDGGDASIHTGTPTATQLQFTSVAEALTAGTTNYFIVVDVSASVNGLTAAIEPSFSGADITFITPSGTAGAVTVTGQNYSFVDASPPAITSLTPIDGATGVTVLLTTFSITFNEPVAYVGDNSDDANRIRIWDDDGNSFVETINVIDVSIVGNVATFITDFSFDSDIDYDVVIGNSVFEDMAANPFPGTAVDDWQFETEFDPNITSMSDAIVCIGDQMTINGARFTGTGGSGNTQPFVFINGVQVTPANITAFNSTTITLTVPSGVSTGNVTVQNRDNLLTSNGDPLTVHPQIVTAVSVTPATFSPAQGTNVNITLSPTQDNNYTYALIITAAPPGYSTSPPSTVDTEPGNGGSQILNTVDNLDVFGNYDYMVEVSRTGCTTRPLPSTFQLTVDELEVNVSSTDFDGTVCSGSDITLIGAASGGTGFYQFRWTSTPVGFSSNESSPTVTPISNIRYNLELEDNAGNIVNDFIDIIVSAPPAATIVPAPGETSVRTDYVIENAYYRLNGTPAGGAFSGPGVILSGSFYYFNPFNAGLGSKNIVYTVTDGFGCAGTDTEVFNVQNAVIDGLDIQYCNNVSSDDPLTPAANLQLFPATPALNGRQFTRMTLYAYNYANNVYCMSETNIWSYPVCGGTNPLTATYALVPDIQAGVGLVPLGTQFNQPQSYTLNLDVLRANFGYSTTDYTSGFYFAIYIWGKDRFGNESYVSSQFVNVLDNQTAPNIVGITQNQNICSNSSVITLSSSQPGYAISNFSISGGFSSSLSGTNNRDFDPTHADFITAGNDDEPLIITMAYSDFNNCPNTVTRDFRWVKKPDLPIANDTAFCQFSNPLTYKLKARKSGDVDKMFWYDVSNVLLESGTLIFDVVGIDGLNQDSEKFKVRQNNFGCFGDPLEVTIFINPAPSATFTTSSICEDRDFILTGPEEAPGDPYLKYEWNFDDGNSIVVLGNNTTTYNYGTALNDYEIGLSITTDLGCTSSSTLAVLVGPNPRPDFTYDFVCENDKTEFTGSSNIPVIDYQWNFDDGTLIPRGNSGNTYIEGGTIKNPHHTFTGGVDNYDVTITAFTASGCSDSKIKRVSILEYLTHTTNSPYDMASVDGGEGYWELEDINLNSTWEFAQPQTALMNGFTSPAWVTNATGNYAPGEYSFLNSPCLNIMNIDRPVLSFNFAMQTDQNRDGIAFEYSKNGGVTWLPLGGPNSGFNWFNTIGFTTAPIGNSSVGFSGNSSDFADNVSGSPLVQVRRALDNISNLSLAERAKVRFRIAFKTNGDEELDGVAFNNLTIASRNRVLLVENFTNEGDDLYADNNTWYKAISISEAVKIQYHVAAPGADANYQINTEDPSARAAFYGIPLTTQAIPRGYIDGHSNGNFYNNAWVDPQFSQRALKVAPYTIVVGTIQSDDPAYIKVTATVTALEGIPGFRKPILHIALVEKTTGDNEYVLRKLVPSALGKKLPAMAQSDIFNIVDSVRIGNPGIDNSQLAIVAFVQDEVTREVYQAAIEMNPANLPVGTVTGTEDPNYAERINLFPNPANNELNIQLPAAALKNTPMRMIDTYGRTVYENSFAPGERNKTINTSELIDGVYIMQMDTPTGKKAIRKIMVMHR